MKIAFLENEYWYGMAVKYGMQMPIAPGDHKVFDSTINKTPNQMMPMLVSTKGRSIWNSSGFRLEVVGDSLLMDDTCVLEEVEGGLKEAYLHVMRKYFPFRGKLPAEELFQKIIYNTWIELTFYQNQKDILKYASAILKHGMPSGVLMIDDGWSESYGDWRFHSGKFPEPEEMIEKLHNMGYKIMLWVCPYVTPDSIRYREAEKKKFLIQTSEGETYIAKWWNGYSAVLDMSNPEAVAWMKEQLDCLIKAGIDGFKFDAGDSIYYRDDNVTFGNVSPDEQSRLWATFGEQYPFNEYRVTFRAGGYGLMQRLCDKAHSWGKHGVASLIPDMLLQGITGHPFGCPDMVGGGEYMNFQNIEKKGLDEELFVRHSEIACLMPAIQFSAAPFRVLSEENFAAILKSIEMREKYLPYIMEELQEISRTGEPLVRYMSYEFPDAGVEKIIDQFMLGSRYLVAPVYEKGCKGRKVYLPEGIWMLEEEKIISQGQEMHYSTQQGVPLVFERK